MESRATYGMRWEVIWIRIQIMESGAIYGIIYIMEAEQLIKQHIEQYI